MKFQDLNPAQKRVAIAQDVIEQLRAKRFVAAKKVYLRINQIDILATRGNSNNLQAFLTGLSMPEKDDCKACAVGGTFLSICRLDSEYENPIKEEPEHVIKKMKLFLAKYFSLRQIGLIESAFETSAHNFNHEVNISESAPKHLLEAAENFGLRYEYDSEQRLIAIMQNIIDNNGCFIPISDSSTTCDC
jgi:hypothetical protein